MDSRTPELYSMVQARRATIKILQRKFTQNAYMYTQLIYSEMCDNYKNFIENNNTENELSATTKPFASFETIHQCM